MVPFYEFISEGLDSFNIFFNNKTAVNERKSECFYAYMLRMYFIQIAKFSFFFLEIKKINRMENLYEKIGAIK